MTPIETLVAHLRERIADLEAQCAELRVGNEMLQYRLEREQRWVRELERQIPAASPPTDPPLGWGKGKDE